MSHLVEVYAKDLGVKIGDPIFKPHFYPILEDNYITIHTDNKVPAKEYDYWEEVIIIVKERLPEIKFIQIGSGKEPKIKNADKFIKTESIKQSAYIIEKSLMHVGIDSMPVHIASSFNKKIVAVYSHTYASTCGPIWGDRENYCVIESHRNGLKPSFSLKESPKTINLIKPEEISNAILTKLGGDKSSRETLYIGDKYKTPLIQIIPDKKYSCSNANISLRLDLLHKEENVLHLFSNNKVSIITKKPLSDDILSKPNIEGIHYFSNTFDADFVEKVKKKGLDLHLFCIKEKNLSEQRFKFFDEKINLFERHKKIRHNKKKFKLGEGDFNVKSYNIYYKGGEAHTSLYEANGKKKINDIFLDLEHLMIYKDGDE